MSTNMEVFELGLYLLALSTACFFLMWACKHTFKNLIVQLSFATILCGCGLFMLLGFLITTGHLLGFWVIRA